MRIIFKGDNYNEKFFAASMLVFLSIIMIGSIFLGETTFVGKIFLGITGTLCLVFPLYSFFKLRYEILFEENQIKITYTSKQKKEAILYYTDLLNITFTNPPKGSDHIIFLFKKQGRFNRKFIIELTDREAIIQLIEHCKIQNPATKFEASPVHGELFNYIKRELKG